MGEWGWDGENKQDHHFIGPMTLPDQLTKVVGNIMFCTYVTNQQMHFDKYVQSYFILHQNTPPCPRM
jgi:hypothetical protein